MEVSRTAITLCVEPTTTISKVKELLLTKLPVADVSPSLIKLKFHGSSLDNVDKTLDAYGITMDSTLELAPLLVPSKLPLIHTSVCFITKWMCLPAYNVKLRNQRCRTA